MSRECCGREHRSKQGLVTESPLKMSIMQPVGFGPLVFRIPGPKVHLIVSGYLQMHGGVILVETTMRKECCGCRIQQIR